MTAVPDINQRAGYIEFLRRPFVPRLPLDGKLDITYRCNYNCLHCWVRIPHHAKEKENEISFAEIRTIVDAAKNMGCRRWSISGGEPMLRPDFEEIFDYITSNSISYSINTNGSLITPKIAQLMKRRGTKMVALYGATKEVYEHITRTPGSFEAVMHGFAYLRKAGAGFIVQLIPLKDNYHQFQDMVTLAQSLSKHYRVGASWLYLSACGDTQRNCEIIYQRLPPHTAIELDRPDVSYQEWWRREISRACCSGNTSGDLFAHCISLRRDFHIDSYAKMSFCSFIKDPALRYDLRKGDFEDCWQNFIPSLAKGIKANKEYKENCGSCELRNECRWCPVYGYLEHRRFSAKVEYLCAIAKESKKFKDNWRRHHRRYFRIADITIQIDSDLPIQHETFQPRFKQFEVDGPGDDTIAIQHHFSLPDIDNEDLGKEVYHKPPWVIYQKDGSWIYFGISPTTDLRRLHRVAVFNSNYTRASVYSADEKIFREGNLHSLTLFPTDQILIAMVLADREGCYLHACGINFQGKGLLFIGHSGAGKSTIATMLKDKAEVLCDDRMIVRKMPEGFKIYGTWSHGDVQDVSANSAPLKAILFLKKSKENHLMPLIRDKKEVTKRLLSCLIKPFVTVDWWDKTLSFVEKISEEAPCYVLEFNKNSKVVDLLKQL